jgi:hypothetical protein
MRSSFEVMFFAFKFKAKQVLMVAKFFNNICVEHDEAFATISKVNNHQKNRFSYRICGFIIAQNYSNRPPAERVALGSPPEGGVGFRKAPLGPLSEAT